MQLYNWNPWSLFNELERSMFATGSSEWPQFDIEDNDDETVLSADLPGMGEDDIEVTVSAPYLIVRGERRAKEGRYVRRARFHGTFDVTQAQGDCLWKPVTRIRIKGEGRLTDPAT